MLASAAGQGRAIVEPQKDGSVLMTLAAIQTDAIATAGGQPVTGKHSVPAITFTWTPKSCGQVYGCT